MYEPEFEEIPPDAEYAPEGTEFADYGKAFSSGLVGDTSQAIGYGLDVLGADETGQRLQKFGRDYSAEKTASMTPDARNADPWSPQGIGLSVARSAGGMVPMAAGGGLAVKGMGVLAKGLNAGVKTGVGFGVSEGLYTGGIAGSEMEHRIRSATYQQLAEQPEFVKAYANTDPSMPFNERMETAREFIANEAGKEVAGRTALTTGGIGLATGGGALGVMSRGGDGVLRSAAKGVVSEATQEIPQSGTERLHQNVIEGKYLNKDQDATEGVVEDALLGGVVGGITGGAFGGLGGLGSRNKPYEEKGELEETTPLNPNMTAGLDLGEVVRRDESNITAGLDLGEGVRRDKQEQPEISEEDLKEGNRLLEEARLNRLAEDARESDTFNDDMLLLAKSLGPKGEEILKRGAIQGLSNKEIIDQLNEEKSHEGVKNEYKQRIETTGDSAKDGQRDISDLNEGSGLSPTQAGYGRDETITDDTGGESQTIGKRETGQQQQEPAFRPTHLTSDNEPVIATDEENIYVNEQGQEIEDASASEFQPVVENERVDDTNRVPGLAGRNSRNDSTLPEKPIENTGTSSNNTTNDDVADNLQNEKQEESTQKTTSKTEKEQLPGILNDSESLYLKKEIKKFKDEHKDAVKGAIDNHEQKLRDSYDQNVNEALASLTYEQFSDLPDNQGFDEDTVREMHQGLVDEYAPKDIEQQTTNVKEGTTGDSQNIDTTKNQPDVKKETKNEVLTEDKTIKQDPAIQDEVKPTKNNVKKLRDIASKLEQKAEASLNQDRATHTPRMARQASSATESALFEKDLSQTISNIATAIESGNIKKLSKINAKTQVELIDQLLRVAMRRRNRVIFETYAEQEKHKGRKPEDEDINYIKYPFPEINKENETKLKQALSKTDAGKSLAKSITGSINQEQYNKIVKLLGKKEAEYQVGWYPIEEMKNVARLKKIGIESQKDLEEATREYINIRSGQTKADPIKQMELDIVGKKLGVDFFPTPKALSDRMADMAGITEGSDILEPSAGNGNLADAAKERGANVDVIEISGQLADILKAKGYNHVSSDFMEHDSDKKYDAIIMNPPFSKNQDSQHIKKAFTLLKPEGKLVAIAGEGVFFRKDKKSTEFREWLEENSAEVEKLPENTFKDKKLQATTGVNARLIVLEKPNAKLSVSEGGQSTVDEITKTLSRKARQMIKKGTLEVVEQSPEGVNTNAQGVFHNGKIYLVANNLLKENAQAVLNHELFHRYLAKNPKIKAKLIKHKAGIQDSFSDLFDRDYNAKYRDMMAEAMRRVNEAGTNQENRVEELAAHLVEVYSQDPTSIPARLRKAVQDFIAFIRSIAYRAGVNLKLTPADLAALARSATRGTAKTEETLYSFKDRLKNFNAKLDEGVSRENKEKYGIFNDKLGYLGDKATRYLTTLDNLARNNKVVRPFLDMSKSMQMHKDEILSVTNDAVQAYNKIGNHGVRAALRSTFDVEKGKSLQQKKLDKALFEGTLSNTVYKDTQLKNEFGLNDDAIQAYKDIRGYMDEMTTRYQDALLERIGIKRNGENLELIDPSGDVKKDNNKIASGEKILQDFKGLTGYFPLMRFGEHTITVKDSDGEVVYFSAEESKNKAVIHANNVRKKFDRTHNITVGFMSQNKRDDLAFDPRMMNMLSKYMDVPGFENIFEEVEQDILKNFSSSEFKKRFIHRKGTEGYSKDLARTLASYGWSSSNYISKLKFVPKLQTYIDEMDKHTYPKTKDHLQDTLDYMKKAQKEYQELKSFTFMYYMGLNVKSAAVNLTQIPVTLGPFLANKFGDVKTAKAISMALKEAAKNPRGNVGEYLKWAEKEGLTFDAYLGELIGAATGKRAAQARLANKSLETMTLLFSHAERYNRRVSVAAAYHLTKDMSLSEINEMLVEAGHESQIKHKDAVKEFMALTVTKTQFDYGKYNKAGAFRGWGSVPLQFNQFMINYLQFIAGNGGGVGASVRSLGMVFFFAGLMGMPGAEDLMAALEYAYTKITDKHIDLQLESRKALVNASETFLSDSMAREFAEMALYGAGSLTPMDISGSVGAGRVVPGLKDFFETAKDKGEVAGMGRLIMGAAGASAGIVKKTFRGLEEFEKSGEFSRAAEKINITSVQNVIKAFRMAVDGVDRNYSGKISISYEPDFFDTFAQALSFTPGERKKLYREKNAEYRESAFLRKAHQKMLTRLSSALADRDKERAIEARQLIREWNREVPRKWRLPASKVERSMKARRKSFDTASTNKTRALQKQFKENRTYYAQ